MNKAKRNEHFTRQQQRTRNVTSDVISITSVIILIYLALTWK